MVSEQYKLAGPVHPMVGAEAYGDSNGLLPSGYDYLIHVRSQVSALIEPLQMKKLSGANETNRKEGDALSKDEGDDSGGEEGEEAGPAHLCYQAYRR